MNAIGKNIVLVAMVVIVVGLAFVSVSDGQAIEEKTVEMASFAPVQFDCVQGTPGCPSLCDDGLEGC